MNMAEIANYVGLGFWVFTILLVLIGALKGRSRGIRRQGVRTLTILLSVLLAFLCTKLAFNSVASFVEEKGMVGLIELIESKGLDSIDEETKNILIHISPVTVNLVLAIPMAILILPFMFTGSFVFISFLMLIVHAIICKFAKFTKYDNTSKTRLFGAILGALQGVAVAIIFFLPFTGTLSVASDAVADLRKDNPDGEVTQEITEVYDEYIEPFAENSAVKTLGGAGGKLLYKAVGTVKVDGQKYKIADELVTPTVKLIGSISAITDIDFENMTAEDEEAINALIDIVIDSPYMRSLIAHVLDDVATAYVDGAIGDEEDEMIKSIISVFVDMDENSVKATLELLRDAIFIVGVDFENITDADKASIQKLIDAIENDTYKKELLADILSAVATAISEDSEGEGDEILDAVLSVFIDIDPDLIAPTLDLVVDASFLIGAEELGENEINTLIASIEDDSRKAEMLAVILDAVAGALEDENAEEGDLMNAIVGVFVGIEAEEVLPTLELIRDAMFMTEMDWEEVTEEDEAKIDALIASAKADTIKADMLAKILDSVATALNDDESTDPLVNAVLSVFVGIDGPSVAPALEVMRESTFLVDVNWRNFTQQNEEDLDALIAIAKADAKKAEILATMLDAVAESIQQNNSNSGIVKAVLSVFNGMEGPDVAPTLEVISDSLFLTDIEWDNMSEDDENKLNALIATAKADTKKADVLATMLDSVAESITADAEEGDLVSAILSVFDEIEGDEVAPTLEVIRDSLFLADIDWTDMSEEDENDLDALIATANADIKKAEVLATMLDSVAESISETSEDGDLVNAILSVFDGIQPNEVAPTLEVIRDSLFMADMTWEEMTEEDKANLNVLIDSAKTNNTKAEILATMLDAVAEELGKDTDQDGFVKAILTVFDEIEAAEVAPTLEVIRDSMFMANADDWQHDISDEDREALDNLIESSRSDAVKSEILATILDALADEFDTITGDDATVTEELMESLFSVFDDVTKEEVVPTLEVVRDVLFMLDDENAMSTLSNNPASLTDIFSKKDENEELLIDRVIDKLNSHDNTKPLVSSFTKISITIMAEKANEGTGDSVEVTEETYESVKTGVKDIVNINQNHNAADIEVGTPEYEEYVSDVSDALSNTFTDNGFEVEKDVVDEMANYVAENYKDNSEELTDDEVNDIILNYYSAYLQGGTLPTP